MVMINYLNLVLIVGAVVLTARSLPLRYPDNRPQMKHNPVSLEYGQRVHKPQPESKLLFGKAPVPAIHQHPDMLKKKPSHWNHMPSPASATPVYTIEPPKHPVYPGNEPPPPACKASTAYDYHYGHPPADETGN
ncbi:extensin-like [Daucus carota subsp. sativus]|uniref:extensin-like n=1 Tax=Daucus carota subsp. sativus TaxID=79200 RepID=UPI0007EF535A|nr:PREDICTED: extensin-like [Daucus carota subsp. sativus]